MKVLIKPAQMMKKIFGTIEEQLLDFLKSEELSGRIELEARLGRICSSITNERVVFDVKHPVIMGHGTRGIFFKSGVEHSFFNNLKALHSGSSVVQTNDTVYLLQYNIRKIVNDKQITYQRKNRLRTITIYCPNYDYDVRVAFSTEEQISPEEVGEISSEMHSDATDESVPNEREKRRSTACKVIQVRNRNRESYKYDNYTADFTVVNKGKNTEDDSKSTFEVEIEVTNENYDAREFSAIILNLPKKGAQI